MHNNQYEVQDEQEIKLSDYLNIVLRFKWIVISIFIVVMVGAYFYISKAPRIYKSVSKVLIEDFE